MRFKGREGEEEMSARPAHQNGKREGGRGLRLHHFYAKRREKDGEGGKGGGEKKSSSSPFRSVERGKKKKKKEKKPSPNSYLITHTSFPSDI